MFQDRETIGIFALFVLVMCVIGVGFIYVYKDNVRYHSEVGHGKEEQPLVFRVKVADEQFYPIKDALVTITDGDLIFSKTTDEFGLVGFLNINGEKVLVSVEKEGYDKSSRFCFSNEMSEFKLKTVSNESQIILKLHGSNTIGAQLCPALAEKYLEKLGAVNIKTQVSKNIVEEKRVVGTKGNLDIVVEIKAHGSSTGFRSLDKSMCDIAMASRPIKESELKMLAKFGQLDSSASEHIIGLDGVAVIIHPSNPVKSLSINDIADIFTGRITNWESIEGSGLSGNIAVYARDENSGTYDTFKNLVLKKEPLMETSKRFESNADLSGAVCENSLAIGFTGLPYVMNSKAVGIRNYNGDVILPTFFTVGTEDYPLSRRLFLYTPEVLKNVHALNFVNFVLSDEGQSLVEKYGFVDLRIKSFAFTRDENFKYQDKNVAQNYLVKIKSGKRLSLNFRFKINSKVLDNKSLRDLQRVVHFLQNDVNSDFRVLVAGFTDSKGDYSYNYDLAKERGLIVYNELKARGIYDIESLSVGEEFPVASNENSSGRSKNRRVEIWLIPRHYPSK